MGILLNMPTADLIGITGFQANVITNLDDGLTLAVNSLYVLKGNSDYTINLPATPSNGDVIKIKNLLDDNIEVTVASNTIDGSTQTIEVDTPGINFELIYTDATEGWIVF